MDDLMADARLWLLGTSGQTKVVIIVNFTDDKRGLYSQVSSAPSTDAGTGDEDADPDTDAGVLP